MSCSDSLIHAQDIIKLNPPDEDTTVLTKLIKRHDSWSLNVDGLSNRKGSEVGIILQGPDDIILEQDIRFTSDTSNIQAKYKALIIGLKIY